MNASIEWWRWSRVIEIAEIFDSPFLVCGGKIGYTSESRARSAVAKRCTAVNHRLYLYRCPRCGMIHMTKHPPEIYRLRSQDSAACAARAKAPTVSTDPSVSTGQKSRHTKIATIGIR